MLNKGEKYEVLKTIRHCCNLGLLPARVDLSTWDFQPHANWLSHLSFSLFVLHAMYKLGGLVSVYVLNIQSPLHEMIFHAAIASAAVVYIYWYYIIYVKHPRLFGVYVKMTLTGNLEDVAADGEQKRSWSRRLKEWTPQDLFVLSLPYMIACGVVAILPAFISHPSMRLLLCSALPKEHQTWPVFAMLLLEEFRFIVALMSIPIPVWMLQVISIDLVNSKLEELVKSLRRPVCLEHVYKSLRHIQIYVSITNFVNCFIIFTFKVLCITMSIGTGYAAIAHFSDYPFFGILYYIIFLDCSFIYTFCYGKAYKIPAWFEQATKMAMLQVRHQKSRRSKRFKMKIRSIPRVGIKVGEFHMMERESTLRFVHHVVNNIVAMLVATRPA